MWVTGVQRAPKWKRRSHEGQDPQAGVGLGCRGRCFCWRTAKVSSLMSAMWSSEQARQTAPLKSPSSLTATREVSDSSGSYNWVLMAATSVWRGWGGSDSVLIWLLKFLTRSYQRPPFFGAQRHWEPKRKRRSHEGGSFWATTASIKEVSLLAASSRKARRILLISFTEFLGGGRWVSSIGNLLQCFQANLLHWFGWSHWLKILVRGPMVHHLLREGGSGSPGIGWRLGHGFGPNQSLLMWRPCGSGRMLGLSLALL